jgi:hypothetical protein
VHDVTPFQCRTCATLERLRASGCAVLIITHPAVTADTRPPKSRKLSPISVSPTPRVMRCCERSSGFFFPRCDRYSGADDRILCSGSMACVPASHPGVGHRRESAWSRWKNPVEQPRHRPVCPLHVDQYASCFLLYQYNRKSFGASGPVKLAEFARTSVGPMS